MSLADIALEALSEKDILQLVHSGVPEGARIEYKQSAYGASDADKKEFLKDLTSFANTAGGHLIIGVSESEGIPNDVTPLTGDADAELQKLESLARDCVEPRINGVQMTAVRLAAGGHLIVVRLPRSWNAPHRVTYKGSSRFYGRTSAGAFELSVDELRAKFLSSATGYDNALAFRARRLAMISSDEGVVPLARDDGRLIVHIVPLSPPREASIDLVLAMENSETFIPIGSTGWSPEYNFDGFANVRSGESIFGYTQLFRDGSIEATKIRIVTTNDGVRRLPANSFGTPIMKSVPRYLQGLQDLGLETPLLVMITIEGIRGAYLGHSSGQWIEESPAIRQNILELPPIIVSEYSDVETYQKALRPAFDALWNAGGLAYCTYFDQDGNWSPTP